MNFVGLEFSRRKVCFTSLAQNSLFLMKSSSVNYLNPFYGHSTPFFLKVMLYEHFIVNTIYCSSFHLLALDFITATVPWRPGGKFFKIIFLEPCVNGMYVMYIR
jgi:hypothetical protein